jgi:hypothetical protein
MKSFSWRCSRVKATIGPGDIPLSNVPARSTMGGQLPGGSVHG